MRFVQKVMMDEHYGTYGDQYHVVMIGVQGSQNYGLDTENSDVDTKMLVTPSFIDIVKGRDPVSTTKILSNDEHCDIKDIRGYWKILLKQNINFVELLFSKYTYIYPSYLDIWYEILEHREDIARYNPYAAIRGIRGMAYQKFAALCHPYPSKLEVLEKFGYDPKQLHHIVRLLYFLEDYGEGLPYKDCLMAPNADYLKALKTNGAGLDLEGATALAERSLRQIDDLTDFYCTDLDKKGNKDVEEFLDYSLEVIISRALKRELKAHE